MWLIIRDALAAASPPVRRMVRRVLGFCLFMLLLQAWDSRDGQGASGIAEFASVALGVAGIGLLGLAHSLHLVMREAAARTTPGVDGPGVERVLLALPAVGFIAGVTLGGAALLMGVRFLLGTEWPLALVGVILYGVFMLIAGRVVIGSARTLFDFAAQQAETAAVLRTAAATARVEALQARMNPHMLFNALNTVASLIRTDPARAERVVEDLGDVLRMGLDRSDRAFTTLASDIEYVQACLAVDRERWGSALIVEWQVSEGLGDCLVPVFLIQPLVENALKHGLGGRLHGGTVRIGVRGEGGDLVVTVEDDGVGFTPAWCEGVGLGTLRQRLQTLYGDRASLVIRPVARGASVEVRVPRRREEETDAGVDRR